MKKETATYFVCSNGHRLVIDHCPEEWDTFTCKCGKVGKKITEIVFNDLHAKKKV